MRTRISFLGAVKLMRTRVLSKETVAKYPDIKTTNVCGLVLLEAGDDVIETTRGSIKFQSARFYGN